MKKVSLQIDSCANCFFKGYDKKKPICVYSAVMVNGVPAPIDNVKVIPEFCPLMDATPQDSSPAPIFAQIEKHGQLTVNIKLD